MFRLSDSTKVIKYRDMVLYANNSNGKWLRFSEEIDALITFYLEHQDGILLKDIEFMRNDDKEFFNSIIERLLKMRIIESHEVSKNISNKSVAIEITNQCNLRCRHCCVNAGEECDFEFSTVELKDVLRKSMEWNPLCINLSGGEPMIREDFFEVLAYLRENFDGDISLSTNGTLITKHNARKLCALVDKIDISIDGVDEESCSKIRGPGVYEKVLEAVKILHENDFTTISLSMVFSDTNEHLEDNFYQLNERLGTKALPRLYVNVGRGKENRKLFTKKTKYESYVPTNFLSEENSESIGFCSCSAGKDMIFVRYDGSIYPCPSYMKEHYLMGNILKINSINNVTADNIDKLVWRHMTSANMTNCSMCKECPVKDFCWSCLGDTDRFPTEISLQKYCELTKPILMRRVWG